MDFRFEIRIGSKKLSIDRRSSLVKLNEDERTDDEAEWDAQRAYNTPQEKTHSPRLPTASSFCHTCVTATSDVRVCISEGVPGRGFVLLSFWS